MTIFGPYAPPTFRSRNGVAQRFAIACSALGWRREWRVASYK
jgi:hypothetical protein